MVVTGEARSGKSCFMYHIAELWHEANPRKNVYVVNFPQSKKHLLPKYIKTISKFAIDKVEDSLLLIEETAIAVPSRNWYRTFNKLLSRLLAIHGHKKQRIIAVTQHLSLIDRNILVMCKYLAVKPYSYFSYKMEREELREIISRAWLLYEILKPESIKKYIILYNVTDSPLIYRYDPPSFWSEELSHAWDIYTFKEIKEQEDTGLGSSITEIIEDLMIQRKIKHWKDLLKYEELKSVKPQVLKALFYRVKKRLRS